MLADTEWQSIAVMGAVSLEKQFLASFLQDLEKNRVALPSLPEVALQVRKIVNGYWKPS